MATCPDLKLVLFIAILATRLDYNHDKLVMARPLPLASSSSSSLLGRLKLDEESSNCWDSLMQLQACTGEIIIFFLNGETSLGHGCCEAISTITKQCWPNLIDTIGFTTEEENILEGYCIKEIDDSPPLPPSLPKVVPDNKVVLKSVP